MMECVNDLGVGAMRQGSNSGGEKMTNIDLSWLFSCLVGAVRTPRCIPFPPIISLRSPQPNEFPTGS